MSEIEIVAFENGPYVIAGRAATPGADGRLVEHPGSSVALCRCGHSGRLPFCDGAHRQTAFRAPETRVRLTPDGGSG